MGEVSLETSPKNNDSRHDKLRKQYEEPCLVSDRWLLPNSSLTSFDTKTHAISVLKIETKYFRS